MTPAPSDRHRLGSWRVVAALAILAALLITLPPVSGSAAAKPGCNRHAHGYCTGRLVGPLVISGRRILDAGQGRVPVLLQGAMFDGPGWLNGQPSYNPKGFPDAGAIRTLKAWGVNMVRLALSADLYNQHCPHEDYAASYPHPGYRQDVADTVRSLTSSGIYVDILLYTSNPDCRFSGPNTSGLAPMPGQDAVGFWRDVASRYSDNPLVGFEPWNEPEVCATSATTAGPATGTCSQSQLSSGWAKSLQMKNGTPYGDVGMERLYQVIHAAAPSSLVFLDANGWASQASTFDYLPADMARSRQIVYALHPYDCQDKTSPLKGARTTATCAEPSPEACWTIAARLGGFDVDPLTHTRLSRPVVFSEIGFPEWEQVYQAPHAGHGRALEGRIKLYQHGLFLHNFVAQAQARGEGFAFFTLNDADTGSSWNGPYLLTQQPVPPGSRGPWPASPDGAVLKRAGTGPALSCVSPPPGYDTWG